MLKKIRRLLTGVDRLEDMPEQQAPGQPPLRVLMVCSGNICRSPTAEGVLRHKLRRVGMAGVEVDSAGTQGFHISEPPDPRAVAAAAMRGYDLSKLRARPISDDDLAKFDWLLAMDEGHLRWLNKRLPAAQVGRAQLFMVQAGRQQLSTIVPDPYFGGPEGFERVLDLVEDGCDGLVQRIAERRLTP